MSRKEEDDSSGPPSYPKSVVTPRLPTRPRLVHVLLLSCLPSSLASCSYLFILKPPRLQGWLLWLLKWRRNTNLSVCDDILFGSRILDVWESSSCDGWKQTAMNARPLDVSRVAPPPVCCTSSQSKRIQHSKPRTESTTTHWPTFWSMLGQTSSDSLHLSIVAFEMCMLYQPILRCRRLHGKQG